MCGILAILLADISQRVNQDLFDGLTVLQHRGQDAAGMITSDGRRMFMRKDNGYVKEVFELKHMLNLQGFCGIAHVRYPTAGTSSTAEAQPFYTNSPFGIALAHNGNLTNQSELSASLHNTRHINTDSDSEVLLNIFADELSQQVFPLSPRVVYINLGMRVVEVP